LVQGPRRACAANALHNGKLENREIVPLPELAANADHGLGIATYWHRDGIAAAAQVRLLATGATAASRTLHVARFSIFR
jgi:hypothetical protein